VWQLLMQAQPGWVPCSVQLQWSARKWKLK
jgi:hypothetical protein